MSQPPKYIHCVYFMHVFIIRISYTVYAYGTYIDTIYHTICMMPTFVMKISNCFEFRLHFSFCSAFFSQVYFLFVLFTSLLCVSYVVTLDVCVELNVISGCLFPLKKISGLGFFFCILFLWLSLFFCLVCNIFTYSENYLRELFRW